MTSFSYPASLLVTNSLIFVYLKMSILAAFSKDIFSGRRLPGGLCASFCLQHFKRLSPLWPPLSPARSLAYPRAAAGKCHLALAAFRF